MLELFGVLIGLAIVMLVGHGLWVLLAAIFGGYANPGRQPLPRPRVCPQCGSRRTAFGSCLDCGSPVSSIDSAAAPVDAWKEAVRQLNRLHAEGLLSHERYREMTAILRSEQKLAEQVPVETKPAPIAREPHAEEPVDIVDFADTEPPQESPADKPAGVVEPAAIARELPAAQPKKRDWGGVFQAFMEEKNIRWGELISAMLIVGSAIGLVISLWSTLQNAIPYFPALLFMVTTAAIHGAGLYTLKRWNLKSTSRGLLLISTLLIPLNFLAAIALSGRPGSPEYVEATNPIYLFAVSIGLLCYGGIAFSSGRVFRKKQWWILWLAVMIPAVGQLVIARQARPEMSTELINLLAAIPLAGFTAAMAAQ
ncbi:MAG: hypothetical protein IID45_04915, partial [Planctomycetes bacterium]|nr:hypothetical protein [Planctomycetota bacterium]